MRGAQLQPLDYVGGSGLKRNNSKPQLQLPEIGVIRQDGNLQERGDSRSQRLVSARAQKHNSLSPINQALLGVASTP